MTRFVSFTCSQRSRRKQRRPISISPRSVTGRQEMADSVFYGLADTPEEAATLPARGMLRIAIEQRIREEGWTQTEAAARLHLTQPRVSDLRHALRSGLPQRSTDPRAPRGNVAHRIVRRRNQLGGCGSQC